MNPHRRVSRASAVLAACLVLAAPSVASASEGDLAASDSTSLFAAMPSGALLAADPGDSLTSAGALFDSTVVLGPPKKRFLLAAGEIIGLNTAIWSYNRFLRENGENPGFRIGFNSWEENFKNGYEWDDNSFSTNQFAHPYHGSMYFNSARSNGYDFWESIPFAFAGSFMWEHFYETHHPSYNDWIATSIGGTSLGEMMWRLSDMILDNRATGGGRRWREVGGLLVNPMRGLTRIVTGEWSRVGPNPEGRFPISHALQFDAGLRSVGEDELWQSDTTRVFLELRGTYGDPFKGDRKKPFDTFEMGAMLNFGEAATLAGVNAHGLLGAKELKNSENTQHLLGAFLNFDYANTFAYEAGQQSVGAGILSRFSKTPLGPLYTQLHLNGIILGGVKSDYGSYTGRDYDYGPGASVVIAGAFHHRGRPWLTLRHGQYWVHTLNGTAGEHHLSITRARVTFPVATAVDLGVQYQLYLSKNDYVDLEDTDHRYPEMRGFVSFPLN